MPGWTETGRRVQQCTEQHPPGYGIEQQIRYTGSPIKIQDLITNRTPMDSKIIAFVQP